MNRSGEGLDYSKESNDEPVFYCKECLSLAIKSVGQIDYCIDCGCTDIGMTTLEHYDELYKIRKGKKLFFKD